MYIPTSFEMSDREVLFDFIDQNSFGILISQGANELLASHLPMLTDRDAEPRGSLFGHFARANSQWKQADGESVLTVFHGPHAYISPSWGETRNSVPTWNYVAVHVYGTLRIIEDRDEVLATLQQSVTKYEASSVEPWSIDVPESEWIDNLLGSIVGFEIDIDRIEGKWKLSQNHNRKRRAGYVAALLEQGGEANRAIAQLMSQD